MGTSTRKASKEARFPRTPKNRFLVKVWHENLQKGRNEGRPKTVKKDKQKSSKASISPFFGSECPKPLFLYCFWRHAKNSGEKSQICHFDQKPFTEKKKNKKRHICAPVAGPETTIFIVVSCVPKTRALLSSHEMPNLVFF